MKLGDAPVDKTTKHELHTNLSEQTDRRLIVVGSMSGAGVVMTATILALLMRALDVNTVRATSGTVLLFGGIATGVVCGGLFSTKLVPRAREQGLLGEVSERDWSGNPLQAWEVLADGDLVTYRF